MKLRLETEIKTTPDKAWAHVKTPALLLRLVEPLATVLPAEQAFPAKWSPGTTYLCTIRIFKLFPIGTRSLHIESVNDSKMEIQSREFDPIVRRWDHLLKVSTRDGCTFYSDELDIEAGVLTWIIWLYAWLFYQHRQRQWRKIAPSLS